MDQQGQVRFGTWLKQQRKSRRLTQEDLAERLACSAVLIQKIEAGQRTATKQLVTLVADWIGIADDDRSTFLRFAREELDVHEAGAKFGLTLPSPPSSRGNLPISLTPLIGRGREVRAVGNLLLDESVRLLTLTGPPGIGKTSLAVQVAHDLRSHFSDGVFFVGLAAILDPELVVAAIANALGVQLKSADPLSVVLQASVRDKKMLLLIDNFEQVLDASPGILELLAACPGLKVLATSREALYVHGEQQYPVPALDTADPTNLPPLEAMEAIPAIALFVERAKAVKPDFVLTEENASAVAAICARLDGLPLAIELAAARIRLLSPREMQLRLESRLSLLTGGPRNLPERQRTLRAAIDWSYNLLSRGEQTLFAHLGVFVGGCTLAAAEATYKTDGDSDVRRALSLEIAKGTESLLDKNLLKRDEGVDGESRFSMLELIREYSLERLRASGNEDQIRALHAQYFLEMAEIAASELMGAEQKLWFAKLEQEHDNVREVLRWSLNRGDSVLALRLGGAMRIFWYVHGHSMEGRRWLEEALAASSDAPASVRALGLRALAHMAQQVSDHKQAILLCEESLALYREGDDLEGIAGVLQVMAFSSMQRGDPERALVLAKEAMALGFDPALRHQTIGLLYTLGGASWFRGDFAQADEFVTKAIALSREEGLAETLAPALNLAALIAHYQGDYCRAEAFYREGISTARRIGALVHLGHPLVNMGSLALLQGDRGRARPLLTEGLKLFAELGNKQGIAEGLEGMACLMGALEQPNRAARLFGAVEALRAGLNTPLPAFIRAVYERTIVASRSQMGEEAFTKAWDEGRAMSMEMAICDALEN